MLLDHIVISFKNFGKYLVINAIIALGITFFFCSSCFFNPDLWSEGAYTWLYSFLLSLALSSGIGLLEEWMNQYIPWTKAPLKRFWLVVLVIAVYSFLASFVVVFLFHWAFGNFTLSQIPWDQLVEQTYNPVIVAYFITFFFTSRSFLMEWRQAAVDAEKLRAERYAGQYQILKDQLNPHFLFNSLNVLANIVYEDQNKAADYIQQLSRFYRYVLDVQQEEVVSLDQELQFAKRYLFLQQLRFEDRLITEIEVSAEANEQIPPLALQLCLENAIKHNEVSQNKPLKIKVFRKADQLCISNNVQARSMEGETPSGIGLKNIRERYHLLSGKEVKVTQNERDFTVCLPILKLKAVVQ